MKKRILISVLFVAGFILLILFLLFRLLPDEIEMAAYHEAGHVLATKLLPLADPVEMVIIIGNGGFTFRTPLKNVDTNSSEYLLTKISIALAGMAAEEIVFHRIENRQSNFDLRVATETAKKLISDKEVKRFISSVRKDTKKLLARHKEKLHLLAKALLARGALDKEEIDQILNSRS